MLSGWKYRVAAVSGAAILTSLAVLVSNLTIVQELFTTYTPLFWRLNPMYLDGDLLTLALLLNTAAVLAVLVPLFRPRPRRVLDTIFLTQKRVIVAGCVLATIGYFNYTYRLPRTTLAITMGILFIVLPVWFVWIRQAASTGAPERVVVIGDDAEQIRELVDALPVSVLGYLCPARVEESLQPEPVPLSADGGTHVRRLGGLSRIEDVLVNYDVDTAVLAFERTDRGEFFGALDACYEYGVTAKVHRQFADAVLTDGDEQGEIVNIAIEPWDPQDYLFKRGFDVAFSALGLVVLLPFIVIISLAIKLEDRGPILYTQERTAGFGESFTVHKFRSMTVDEASPDPDADQDRITRVGGVIRWTHLDEIPQLWTILIGRMSVVGPRAVWVEEESILESTVDPTRWRKRWFVKPGLTGLAQVNDVSSSEADAKLRYDLEYIRRQSFWFDVKIVVRQLWKVVSDLSPF